MNKFCFGGIYNGRLWEKELRVSALKTMKLKVEILLVVLTLIIGSDEQSGKNAKSLEESNPKDRYIRLCGCLLGGGCPLRVGNLFSLYFVHL